jgi:hypothetical protein
MTVLAQLLIAATLVATAVIYGTDVFAAIVLRPALAHVDDRTLTGATGYMHDYADRRLPVPGAIGLAATVLGTAVAFAALAVELGGEAVTPPTGAGRFALTAIGAALAAAASLPGWRRLGAWRFASAVTGGRLIAANTISPWYVVGRRRFMPPIPP